MRISVVQLVVLVTLSIFVTATLAEPKPDEEVTNSKSCKGFCDSCGCAGFYCGEECICECNNNDDKFGAAECIKTVYNNAKKMKTDFEILIQGPKENRFVQDAQEFNQNQHCLHDEENEEGREKRSTVVIYKPEENALKDEVTKIHSKIENLERAIVKREIELQSPKRLSRPLFGRDKSVFGRDKPVFGKKDVNIIQENNLVGDILAVNDQPKINFAADIFGINEQSKNLPKQSNSLTHIEIAPPQSDNGPQDAVPVKRSFGALAELGVLNLAKLNFLGLEPLPECLLEADIDFAADKFREAVVLLKVAADELLANIAVTAEKKKLCFETVLGKKIFLAKLASLPGIKCLAEFFPKVKLCEILDFIKLEEIFKLKLLLPEVIL